MKLPREIWVLCVATLVNRMGTMVLPFLILYLTRELHYSVKQAGFVLSLYGASALVIAPISGWLSDRLGAVRVMPISLFLSGITLLIFPLAQKLPAIVAATLILAVFSEAFRPANMAALGGLTTPEQKKAAFSLNRLAVNLGMSVSPVMAGLLTQVSFLALFWIDAVTTLLASGILLIYSRKLLAFKPKLGLNQNRPLLKSGRLRGALTDSTFRIFLLACVPVGMVFFQHQSTMPLFFVQDLGFSEKTYGLLLAINTVLVLMFEIPLNAATAHWSHPKTMAIGAFLFALGFGALSIVWEIWGVIFTIVLWSFGEMILFPGMSAFISDRAPPEKQGEYMGLFTMAFGLAFVLGPIAGTQILESQGAVTLWILVFGLGIISTGILGTLKVPRNI